ncbi:MAG: CDGSH iron-sulfur domain-containing protein [Planctomycetota bacterium]|nr:CDGSH iron-sulfur domain-containing protein [Planctomycetota bacterium]MDA1178515.1 CDGSH iron-sulfur domain-containing protein [Planctomycetota bacterium]
MSDVIIRCRDNGPLVVSGTVQVTDADGNVFAVRSDKPAIALCRCGASKQRPFCDGSHKDVDFQAAERATVQDS